jgi:hypothetical protein
VRLAGLPPHRRYRVTTGEPSHDRHTMDLAPSWTGGQETGPVAGALLGGAGVRLPVTAPESAYVLRVQAVDGEGKSP